MTQTQDTDRKAVMLQFALDIAVRFPSLDPLRVKNSGPQGDELLCYMFFSDICDQMIAEQTSTSESDAILAHLEAHLQDGDDPVSNLIILGFLENIDPHTPSHDPLKARLSRKLAARHKRLYSY